MEYFGTLIGTMSKSALKPSFEMEYIGDQGHERGSRDLEILDLDIHNVTLGSNKSCKVRRCLMYVLSHARHKLCHFDMDAFQHESVS